MHLPSAMDVWVVDDDASILESLEFAFSNAGWNPQTFSNVGQFKTRLETMAPGCVVADMQIGDESGLDLISHIHATSWPAPSVLISGHLTPTLTMSALRQGTMTVVEKPFALEQLCEEVELARCRGAEMLEAYHHREAAREAIDSLPDGHRAVLRELVECRPHKQIASRIDVSLRTVEKRKKEIFERLNATNFVELLNLLKLANWGDDESCRQPVAL